MEFDLLKAFCQLAKSGNYRLASEQLYITQSALTKKIQRLESNIGASLFSRGRNGAELTHAGKRYWQKPNVWFIQCKRLSSCQALWSKGLRDI
jgi:DNA-binding transcriptional LysR family regulator